jgi:hypothetical protein
MCSAESLHTNQPSTQDAIDALMRTAQFFFPGEQSADLPDPRHRPGHRGHLAVHPPRARLELPLWYLWRPFILYRSRVPDHPTEPGTSGRRWRRIGVRY